MTSRPFEKFLLTTSEMSKVDSPLMQLSRTKFVFELVHRNRISTFRWRSMNDWKFLSLLTCYYEVNRRTHMLGLYPLSACIYIFILSNHRMTKELSTWNLSDILFFWSKIFFKRRSGSCKHRRVLFCLPFHSENVKDNECSESRNETVILVIISCWILIIY